METCSNEQFHLFSTMFSKQSVSKYPLKATFQLSSAASLNLGLFQNGVLGNGLIGDVLLSKMHYRDVLFPKQQILDCYKLKEFEGKMSNLMKTTAVILQTGRKHHGKRRNCSLRAISPFLMVFSRLVLQTRKNQGLFGKG